MKRFNDWLADKMSQWLSNMSTFWILSILILGTLIWQRPSGIQGWALFFVSVFFQGVALVVINHTTDKAAARQEKLLRETHDTVMSELKEMRDIHKEVHTVVNNIHVQSQHNTHEIADALSKALRGRSHEIGR